MKGQAGRETEVKTRRGTSVQRIKLHFFRRKQTFSAISGTHISLDQMDRYLHEACHEKMDAHLY